VNQSSTFRAIRNTLRAQPTIDLRSDSSSLPSTEMLRAITLARLGNDVYGEDPTANELEGTVARMLAKESAVLMPTGVMANQIALSVLAGPDQLIAVGNGSHLLVFEGTMSQRELMPLDDTSDEMFVELAWSARHSVAAVAIENTHLTREGHVMDPGLFDHIAKSGLPIHLDGARLMNAAAALGAQPAEIAACATTVMLTLSKGLGAPIGSVLAGPTVLMNHARQLRQALGGGLAQAGIVASAGLVALRRPLDDFRSDHRRAALLRTAAEHRWPGSTTPRTSVGTNIVIWSPPDIGGVVAQLAESGILVLPWGDSSIRAVTHSGISDQSIDRVVERIASL
jgi:threonine aldolase